MDLQLRTITPLHIGNGEELAPLDYVVFQNHFYHIPQDKLMKFIENSVPNGRRSFADWISEQYAAMRDIRDNRALSRLEGNMNAFTFCHEKGKAKDLINFLNDPTNTILKTPVLLDHFTKKRFGPVAHSSSIPLGRVREAIKTGTGKVYVPGSSLKGALRTAVFYQYLKQYADPAQVERLLRNELHNNRRVRKERFGLPLIQEAFYCKTKDLRRKKEKENDEKMDLFKLVRFSDGILKTAEDSLQLAKVNLYLVERQPSRDRREATWVASQQPQTSYCEIIAPGQDFSTHFDFDITFLLRIKDKIKDNGIYSGNEQHWIGLAKKVKQLFGLDLSELTESNYKEKQQQILVFLLDCQYKFSQRQCEAHRLWIDRFAEHDRKNWFASRVERGFHPVLSNGTNPLMHLGYATGFDGMTAFFYFLEDNQLIKLFKDIMEKFGIGKPPRFKGNYTANPKRFPKSKRLAETDQLIQPLGWLAWVKEGEDILTNAGMEQETEKGWALKAEEPKPVVVIGPEFFTGKINYKKTPVLDAEVVQSGRPNMVKVYITPDNTPEMPLYAYKNPIEKGKLLKVNSQFTKKGKLIQVSFAGWK